MKDKNCKALSNLLRPAIETSGVWRSAFLAEAYLEPCQTSKIEPLVKTVKTFQP